MTVYSPYGQFFSVVDKVTGQEVWKRGDPFDLVINGFKCPGHFRFADDLETTYTYSKSKPTGTTGSVYKFQHVEDRQVTLKITLVTPSDYALYMALYNEALVQPTKERPYGIDIVHPHINDDLGITIAVVLSKTLPLEDERLRMWTASVKIAESSKPKPTAVKTEGTPPKKPVASRETEILAEQAALAEANKADAAVELGRARDIKNDLGL